MRNADSCFQPSCFAALGGNPGFQQGETLAASQSSIRSRSGCFGEPAAGGQVGTSQSSSAERPSTEPRVFDGMRNLTDVVGDSWFAPRYLCASERRTGAIRRMLRAASLALTVRLW